MTNIVYVVRHRESGEFLDNAGELVSLEHCRKNNHYDDAHIEMYCCDNPEEFEVVEMLIKYEELRVM